MKIINIERISKDNRIPMGNMEKGQVAKIVEDQSCYNGLYVICTANNGTVCLLDFSDRWVHLDLDKGLLVELLPKGTQILLEVE